MKTENYQKTSSNKKKMTTTTTTTTNKSANKEDECCMCGDFGFSYELFQCKVCLFRSQHRYCSNLYPNAENYRICNWCLNQKEDTKEKSQNSSNSSSSCKKESQNQDHDPKNMVIISKQQRKNSSSSSSSGLRGSMQLQPSGPIKKQRSLDLHNPHHQVLISSSISLSPNNKNKSLPSISPKSPIGGGSSRKRIMTYGEKEAAAERLRRTRSEEISNNINNSSSNGNGNGNGITRQVFRNKVRRYKLLDEVSSQ